MAEIRKFLKIITETSPLSRGLLIAAIVLPVVYLLVMVQLSAITYPFWDHLELVRFLAKVQDGSLSWSDLVSPHNQTRPLVYRLIYLLNARITDWDIRSEYIILYITLYSTFLLHLFFIRRLVSERDVALLTAALASVVYFSPVGHNNFWWSMMFQLDVTNLFMVAAVIILAIRPVSWLSNILAAALGWLAAYTLTNGIFLFVSAVVVVQLAQPDVRRINRRALFWLINLVVLLAVYLPGIPLGNGWPSVSHFLVFVLAYLGTPLAGLIWYPYRGQFDVPLNMWWPSLVGAAVAVVSIVSLWRARKSLGQRDPATMALFLFVTIAVVSAAATAWGRAEFDQFGVADANSSRYSIFAAYLLFGLIYFYAGSASNAEFRKVAIYSRPLLRASVVTLCFIVAGLTYARGVKIFEASHEFNRLLGRAYVLDDTALPYEKYIYPNLDYVRWAKAQLIRLGLGPYRSTPTENVSVYGKSLASQQPLSAGATVVEEVNVPAGMLFGVSVQLTSAGAKTFRYPINWKVDIDNGGVRQDLASGTIAGAVGSGEKDLPVPLTSLSQNTALRVQLAVAPNEAVISPISLNLYEPADQYRAKGPVVGVPQGVLGLTLKYVRQ